MPLLETTSPCTVRKLPQSPKPQNETDLTSCTDKYNDSTGNYTQTVLVNNKQVAKLSTKDGHAQGWGSAVECADTSCGSVGAHSKFSSFPPFPSCIRYQRKPRADTWVPTAWINTKIILDVADPNYINTLGKGQGVTGDLVTSDNGKTWTVKTISIPAYSF